MFGWFRKLWRYTSIHTGCTPPFKRSLFDIGGTKQIKKIRIGEIFADSTRDLISMII